MTIEQDISIGADAERVLKDPAIERAFDGVRQAIVDKWAMSPIVDRDGQHELRLMLKLLGDVRANLEEAYNAGKFAAEDLKITRQRQSPIAKLRSAFR